MKTTVVSAAQNGAIESAVEKLLAGHLVAVPTETVYGLAADALSEKAVQAIYAAKGRPSFNPLICHVSSKAMADRYVEIPNLAEKLMDALWPGPLTLVLPKRRHCEVAPSVSAGLDTLAMRCPGNEATRAIIKALDRPIAAPSANVSGKLSPTTAEAVLATLKDRIALVVDDGQTGVGIESTIVSVDESSVTMLRPGSITIEEIAEITGETPKSRTGGAINAPGQLESHYAPNAPLSLNQAEPKGRFMIGFGSVDGDLNLSPGGDLAEAAHNLFDFLRRADQATGGTIAVAPIPNRGVGIAINDRLKRAAAPRPNEEAVND